MLSKQEYYEYEPDRDGAHWWRKEVPTAEPWFQEELNRFAGVSDRGQPNLRLVWAENLMHDITHEPQKKYKVVREVARGYNYIKTDGSIGFATSMSTAEDPMVPWQYVPKMELIEIGRLRWCIERHVPAHVLREQGRFVRVTDAEGKRILRDLPEEGVYDHFFWIQTADRKYRDPDREVLMAVEAMYVYNTTVSEAQQALDQIEREQNKTLIGAEEANQIWQGIKEK